ncbi:molybdopterin biosynthesis protein MoeB [compost metagenome]
MPELPAISAVDLKRALDAGTCAVLDLRPSMRFRTAHIPGSRWTIRPRIAAAVRGAKETIVLIADEADVARLAAMDLIDAGMKDLRWLAGGLASWTQAGYATQASPEVPPDAECIDYLFFVHDRHAGNREAMRQYLAWETGLIAQLDPADKALFRVGIP